MVRLYIANINEYDLKDLQNKYTKYLAQDILAKINRFYFNEDKLRSLIGEVLSRYMVCKECNLSFDKIIINRNHYGKAYVENIRNIKFNISHSGDYVVGAINQGEDIGVDIEKIENVEVDLFTQQFSKDEVSYISERKEHFLERFYEVWTIKESFVKAVGKGLSIPIESFEICFNKNTIIRKDISSNYYYKTFDKFKKGYKLSLCIEKTLKEVELIELRNFNM